MKHTSKGLLTSSSTLLLPQGRCGSRGRDVEGFGVMWSRCFWVDASRIDLSPPQQSADAHTHRDTHRSFKERVAGGNDFQWCFSQVKGAIDEDVAEADIISTVEFNYSGDLLATGDKGGRVVIFQHEQESKNRPHLRGEYNVYSTFQSHEPEFDYLKSLEIEEKINKIRWLPQQNAAHFLLSTNDKTIKLWKISERDKRAEGYNLKD
ncbi:hypothetical protein fugu_012360 [Takifugu bimaculatus]|uniref:Serine/threonine-protein phosphatase 2A 55 kDa regulatory subunit B n=1 Tax=Takifugu bimaculatus TaxID=433685 RepID=A0A4Z2C549_9TELE|nr:hypothetical protein fugu_012360 [Takifugu bimaculatus]